MAEHLHQNSVEAGASGNYVNVLEPDPATITVEDIAFMLALTNRFNGATGRTTRAGRRPVADSVGEHSVFVSRRVEQRGGSVEQQLAALLHDAPEYVLNDIVRPVKPLLGDVYADLTEKVEAAVCQALELPFGPAAFHDPIITTADRFAVFVEARAFLISQGRGWAKHADYWDLAEDVPDRIVTPPYFAGGIGPMRAMRDFLKRYHDLKGQL